MYLGAMCLVCVECCISCCIGKTTSTRARDTAAGRERKQPGKPHPTGKPNKKAKSPENRVWSRLGRNVVAMPSTRPNLAQDTSDCCRFLGDHLCMGHAYRVGTSTGRQSLLQAFDRRMNWPKTYNGRRDCFHDNATPRDASQPGGPPLSTWKPKERCPATAADSGLCATLWPHMAWTHA